MTNPTRDRERLSDLAVDRMLGLLSDEDAAEYRRLRDRDPEFDESSLEQAAAALHLATGIAPETMPEHLQRRLLADGMETFGANPRTRAVAIAPDRPRWQGMAGWLAAAACLGALIPMWLDRPSHTAAPNPPPMASNSSGVPRVAESGPDARPTPAGTGIAAALAGSVAGVSDPVRDRARLLAANHHLIQRAWRPGGDPAGLQVSGDVVWDPASQTGYMRFVGLRRNEPNAEQYQLWIFDATRDERYPVDGGVFDVTGARAGDVIPIKAKLPIGVPLIFAVTIERRGGVVVSDRERVAAIANTT